MFESPDDLVDELKSFSGSGINWLKCLTMMAKIEIFVDKVIANISS